MSEAEKRARNGLTSRMRPRLGANWVELTIDGDKTFRVLRRARTGSLTLINKREKGILVSGALLTIPRPFRSEDRASRYEISPGRGCSGGSGEQDEIADAFVAFVPCELYLNIHTRAYLDTRIYTHTRLTAR